MKSEKKLEFSTSNQLGNGCDDRDDDIEEGLSPVSSRYSSCEESEFDRYCSANSVIGTPSSVCSSIGYFNDSLDSDFGPFDSLEGFKLGSSRVSRKLSGKTRSLLGRESGLGGGLSEGRCESSHYREGIEGENVEGSLSNHGVMKEVGKKEDLAVILKNVENVLLQGVVAARSAAENLMECKVADEMDDDRCREQDETSSRCEHSEGEDSMFNYGSDDESNIRSNYGSNVRGYYRREEDGGCGNSMVMNPSIAFGSNDWEDYELDGMENPKEIPDDFWVQRESGCGNETISSDLTLTRSRRVENETNVASNDEDHLDVDESLECFGSSTTKNRTLNTTMEEKANDGSREVLGRYTRIMSDDESDEYLENCSIYNVFQKQSYIEHNVGDNESMTGGKEGKNPDTTREISNDHDNLIPSQCLNSPPQEDLKFDVLQVQGAKVESREECLSNSDSTFLESEEGKIYGDSYLHGSQNSNSQAKDFEMNGLYDEFVHDMEEILLESHIPSSSALKQKNSEFQFEQSSSSRNDESISSSSFHDGDLLIHHPLKIDNIEVVGAKQKKGDISLSDRLVGVKEYTVYIIRIKSGTYQWDVECRYRDFYSLYHQLKTYFSAREWILPPVWSSVDKESRKFFGNTSPNVVSERSTLIQECLRTILESRYSSNLPNALISFLSPPQALLCSSQSNAVTWQSSVGSHPKRVPSLGKTISLIVDIRSHKSEKELLDIQNYACAGCHTRFDNGKTRLLEIVQTFGWGKPRLCEYTGQLFCSSCHTNETAVLPARVLHNWDFSPYPVSQLAKSYLDSIIDKPMLCVSAANPFLFSRVPALLHVVGVRRKIGAMLPYVRCRFHRSIFGRLGYRKYLLESNDFFALRDLIDLSKGAFAGLPAILEAVLKKIEEHITELCLECCDNGVPCGARQACDNLSSLIFPFQEDEISRCKSCKSVFHKHCFNKLAECPCGEVLRGNAKNTSGSSSLAMKKSDSKSSSRLLSSLFSFSRLEKGHKDNDNVILMGSLPGNSL